jgi:hypothetical protein|tara:strand:- start:391 stop:633 length:243 start_codon:yes stop_codon:yes gene_type:complete
MPTYPVINQVTGETKTLNLTMKNYEKWRNDNPDWDRDWSQGCAGVGEVGDWQNKLVKEKPGWNEVLDRASRMPGAAVTKI